MTVPIVTEGFVATPFLSWTKIRTKQIIITWRGEYLQVNHQFHDVVWYCNDGIAMVFCIISMEIQGLVPHGKVSNLQKTHFMRSDKHIVQYVTCKQIILVMYDKIVVDGS